MARLVERVNDLRARPVAGEDFEGMERELRALFAEAEREVVGETLGHVDVDLPFVEMEGRRYRRVLRSHATYTGAAGEVGVHRTLYRCGRERAALPGKPVRILSLLAAALMSQAAPAHDPRPEILAPGWGILSYEAPAPGTYRLPPIMRAADGRVLREDATPAHLFDLMGDRLVLLSFVYTRCTDVNGCPLAKAVFHLVRARLKQHPELAGATRLISLSFDPGNDTPEAMRAYRPKSEDDRVEWRFLTTRDRADLQPILDGYGQYTLREYDEHGVYTGEIAHLLRVFLIDRERRVRNVYSTGFLHPDVLMNDLETLLLESSSG